VVVGAGGAARAVVYALLERGFEVAVANRSIERAHSLAAHFGGRVTAHGLDVLPDLLPRSRLLANATALGASGQPRLAFDLTRLPRGSVVCELSYVPVETALLREAAACGHRTVDGLGMLLHQAVPGFARWFGVTPEVTPALRALVEADINAAVGAG
jgi:shikimate dehydrogenase